MRPLTEFTVGSVWEYIEPIGLSRQIFVVVDEPWWEDEYLKWAVPFVYIVNEMLEELEGAPSNFTDGGRIWHDSVKLA